MGEPCFLPAGVQEGGWNEGQAYGAQTAWLPFMQAFLSAKVAESVGPRSGATHQTIGYCLGPQSGLSESQNHLAPYFGDRAHVTGG